MKEKQQRIVLESINLRKEYGIKENTLIGQAVFQSQVEDRYSSRSEGVSITIVLTPEQCSAIITICGDSLKEAAQRTAQGFYEAAASVSGRLIENKV